MVVCPIEHKDQILISSLFSRLGSGRVWKCIYVQDVASVSWTGITVVYGAIGSNFQVGVNINSQEVLSGIIVECPIHMNVGNQRGVSKELEMQVPDGKGHGFHSLTQNIKVANRSAADMTAALLYSAPGPLRRRDCLGNQLPSGAQSHTS